MQLSSKYIPMKKKKSIVKPKEQLISKSLSFSGKKTSKEIGKKMSKVMKGKIPWNKGRTGVYSKETLEKMSQSQMGKIVSKETRRKLSKAHKGKKHSEASKRKMSKVMKGNIPWNKGRNNIYSKETLEKMSQSQMGKIVSKETRRKLSKAHKGLKH